MTKKYTGEKMSPARTAFSRTSTVYLVIKKTHIIIATYYKLFKIDD